MITLCQSPKTGTVALQLEDGQVRKLLWGQCGSAVLAARCVSETRGVSDGWTSLFCPNPPDSPEPCVAEWCDSSGSVVRFPIPCVQTTLGTIGEEVRSVRTPEVSVRCA